MPHVPAKTGAVAGPDPQGIPATSQPSATRLMQLKEEADMQQLHLQQFQQQQLQQQHFQLQQQAQMQQQMQQMQHSYPQNVGTASGTLGQSTNLVPGAGQAATNAATTGAISGAGYAIPRNSPEFACENVGERVKGKRRKYCPHEVTALVLGVQRYADDSCPWSSILRDPHLGHLFHGRSGVDLKDKWRTLIKTRPELAAYTENRKNHRKYRPFSATEERALLEGVKKYNGQRNVWSLILVDKELGPQFNDRSNVQLKDKFRTMRRAGTTSALLISGGGTPSHRTSGTSTPLATTGTRAMSGTSSGTTLTSRPSPVSTVTTGTSRDPSTVTAASQQAAALLVQKSHAASAMFADPNLYLAGSFALPPHLTHGLNMHHLASTQGRHQSAQAQAQAHAQAQAIANAQARAAQVQLEAQMQHMRAQSGQSLKQQQFQAFNALNGAFSAGVPGYQLMGNQIVPQQALYYSMVPNPSSQQQMHLQQQVQHQMQQRQLQQQQQQQQLAAAIAASTKTQMQQQQQKLHATRETSDERTVANSMKQATGSEEGLLPESRPSASLSAEHNTRTME